MRYDFVKWEAKPGFNGNLNSILIGPDRPAYLQLVRKGDNPTDSAVVFLPIPVGDRRRELLGIYVRLEFAPVSDRPAVGKPDTDQPPRVEEPLGIPELREALRGLDEATARVAVPGSLWPLVDVLVDAARLACGSGLAEADAPSSDGDPALVIGDVVWLKSGGQSMTVKTAADETGRVVCQWFSWFSGGGCAGHRLEEGWFHRDMLELAPGH